ncbi:hypothetical protein GCM10027605_01550 [Micromonospora zhanjiangensis]
MGELGVHRLPVGDVLAGQRERLDLREQLVRVRGDRSIKGHGCILPQNLSWRTLTQPQPPHPWTRGGGAAIVTGTVPAMGALRPWHLAVLCCLITSTALIAGIVLLVMKRNTNRRG